MFNSLRRPNMTDSTSPHDVLVAAERAFAEGNHARLRELVAPLVEGQDNDHRKKAQALLARIEPSPVGKYLFLLTAILLVAVTYFAYSH